MALQVGSDLSDPLYNLLGYCDQTKRVRNGALAEMTHPQIKDRVRTMLKEETGFSEIEAESVLDSTWKDTPENMRIKLTGNLHRRFAELKDEGIKIAICTSDSREGTEQFLDRMELADHVDMVVCGDDAHGKPKPDPHNAHLICRELGVRPQDAVMVGDTPADTLMGQTAQLGLSVGVLSGVGDAHDLADADIIYDDIEDFIDWILPQSATSLKHKTHRVTQRGLSKIAAQGAMAVWLSPGMGRQTRTFSTSAASSASSNSEYSHVIVGAGSAGCVLANRLTEDRSS